MQAAPLPGLPVQPAMELIATVAQGSPGPDGDYSAAIPDEDVQRYLDVAHAHHMLLVLDFQPGRGQFLPQVQHFARFLTDPAVSVALDPEWKMGPGEKPGNVIGSSTSPDILAVRDYLSHLVATKHLPDKLLVIEPVQRIVHERVLSERLTGCRIVPSSLDMYAGAVGAAIASVDRIVADPTGIPMTTEAHLSPTT